MNRFIIVLCVLFIGYGQAQAADCEIPAKGSKRVSSIIRKACLQKATLLFDQPSISREKILNGPDTSELSSKEYLGLSPEESVHCDFFYDGDYGGSSPKFYCLRKNNKGQLYPEKADYNSNGMAQAHPHAYEANRRGHLIGSDGRELLSKKRKSIDGDKLKVKYFKTKRGRIIPRQREGFTEVAATRFFWSLGIPADRMYPVESVICDGCEKDPYGREQSKAASGNQEFPMVTIERKLEGKRIEPIGWKHRHGNKRGFHMDELGQFIGNDKQQKQIEFIHLASTVINFYNAVYFQNRLFCPKYIKTETGRLVKGYDKKTRKCHRPVAMIQDVGASFGRKRKPGDGPFNPRGDIEAYKTEKVWADKSKCQPFYPMGHRRRPKRHFFVRESVRQEFVRRIEKVEPYIEDIVRLARFEKIDSRYRRKVRKKLGTRDEKAIDEAIINEWTQIIKRRIADIKSARCPK